MWHRSTQGQTRRALRGCWFSIGFTRYSLQIGPRTTGGCSSRAISAVTPLYVFCLFPQFFCRFPVNRVRVRWVFFLAKQKMHVFHCFRRFWGMYFFWQGYCTMTLKGKLFSCYMYDFLRNPYIFLIPLRISYIFMIPLRISYISMIPFKIF